MMRCKIEVGAPFTKENFNAEKAKFIHAEQNNSA